MLKRLAYFAILSISSATLAVCVSCTSTSDEPDAATEVKFRTSGVSRSTLITDQSIINNPFAVYGDMVISSSSSATPTVVFNGTEVKYNNGIWNYDATQYWYPSHTYSFVALYPAAPAGIAAINYSENSLSFIYNYPDEYNEATDMLIATHRRVYELGTAHPVAFNFGHIMARINFIVKVDPAFTNSVTIQSLTLKNVGNSATFTIKPADVSSGETDDYYGGKWTEPETATFTLFDVKEPVEVASGDSHEFFPALTNPLLVIPQPVNQDIELEVKYQSGGVSHTGATKLFSTAVTSHSGLWLGGKSYTYTFSIGVNEFILFGTPAIQDWDEDEGGNYIITD